MQCGCMQESYAHDIIGDLSAGAKIGNRLFALIFFYGCEETTLCQDRLGTNMQGMWMI
jgi:hypothetical protein